MKRIIPNIINVSIPLFLLSGTGFTSAVKEYPVPPFLCLIIAVSSFQESGILQLIQNGGCNVSIQFSNACTDTAPVT
ncbi:hypothetical protein BLA28_08080 [Eisenbergiella tayi]|uniref:Uncharacterized protein n=1 Tax=Eisenbergiella tayi TaxID=1432052 RepID=A0ABX3A8J3_9FIRM|nr:hypothetical protein BEI60_22460 [Eisenbergiella tayi]ODR46577.1 hypothetical protein BEI63_27700 [Eisenbergiella tayi]OIZ66860.1 hypothetical protein BLA28_08080 [Eisenbergiella tayi]